MDPTEKMMGGGPAECEVILISGYLGAGKTTLIKNILSWPKGVEVTAVLVNEFGKVGIDGDLLKGLGTPVVELTNGCICCTLQGDLVKCVREVLEGFHPARLLIEATGVADPLEIRGSLTSSRLEGLSGEPWIITVVDGELWEGRDCFGYVFHHQIKAARLLLFNKVDLLPSEKVSLYLQQVREVNPNCSIIPTSYCGIDPELLGKPLPRGGPVETSHHLQGLRETARETAYTAFAFENDVPFTQDCFRRFMETLPPELYRVKGYVLLGRERFFVNRAGGNTEWRKTEETGPTRLAFVGWEISEEEVIRDLRDCLEKAP